jgi:hypothetical protein
MLKASVSGKVDGLRFRHLHADFKSHTGISQTRIYLECECERLRHHVSRKKTAIALEALLRRLAAPAASACSTSDVSVEIIRVWNDGKVATRVLGRLHNRCSTPTAAEIQLLFLGSDGALVSVWRGWPTASVDIDPKSDFPFEFGILQVAGATRVTAKVLRVRRLQELGASR